MSVHAKLSPSGAHRWMACPGSTVLEADYPDTGSIYADEGTAAHLLASTILEGGKAMTVADLIGLEVPVNDHKFVVDADMARYVLDYVKLVREYAERGTLLVEQRVPIDHITGEEGAGGTADAIILAGSEVIVADLKYGMGVRVDAQDNPQLQMYALGVLQQYGLLYDFDTVTMVIHMPRLNHVSEWSIPVADLLRFGEIASTYANEVRDASEDPKPTSPAWIATYLNPGEKQCRFCRAKATCPALRAEVSSTVHDAATLDDFRDLEAVAVSMLTGDNYLSDAMSKVGMIEDWCKAVRAEVERRLLAGQPVPGYKLVEGRRGARRWADEEAATKLLKSFRLKQDEMYDFKLISPTNAEKLLRDNPKRWQKVASLITQSEGKPSVAIATDKRPEMVVPSVADDFSDLAQLRTEEVDN